MTSSEVIEKMSQKCVEPAQMASQRQKYNSSN